MIRLACVLRRSATISRSCLSLSKLSFRAVNGQQIAMLSRLSTPRSPAARVPVASSKNNKREASAKQVNMNPQLDVALKELKIDAINAIQADSAPQILNGHDPVLIAAPTGSGKTLAYLLPIVHQLSHEEQQGSVSKMKRPRAVILVPNRDLGEQVLKVVKHLSHFVRTRSILLTGGRDLGPQVEALRTPVDIVVATPGRLTKLLEYGQISFADVRYLVIDEADTMFLPENGFLDMLDTVLSRLKARDSRAANQAEDAAAQEWIKPVENAARLDATQEFLRRKMAEIKQRNSILDQAKESKTATAPAVESKDDDDDGDLSQYELKPEDLDEEDLAGDHKAQVEFATDPVSKAQRHTQIVLASASISKDMARSLEERFPGLTRVQGSGLHRPVPQLKQLFVRIGARDKLEVLREVLLPKRRWDEGNLPAIEPTIVFCNTIASCTAVQHYLREQGFNVVAYHGDIPAKTRRENYQQFVNGETAVLVATDMGSRGLDTKFVKHVVMFDFPKLSVDYLHRAGRTARAGSSGKVTSLVTQRDAVLAEAIERANADGRPIDQLTADRRHYTDDLRPKLRGKEGRIEQDRRGKVLRDREQLLRKMGFSERDKKEKRERVQRRAYEDRTGETLRKDMEKLRHGRGTTKQARMVKLRQLQDQDQDQARARGQTRDEPGKRGRRTQSEKPSSTSRRRQSSQDNDAPRRSYSVKPRPASQVEEVRKLMHFRNSKLGKVARGQYVSANSREEAVEKLGIRSAESIRRRARKASAPSYRKARENVKEL